MATIQLLEKIRTKLLECGRDTRYRLGGYEFVLNGMEFYLTSLGEKRHVSGQELTRGLLVFSHKQFGPLAESVLHHWGIDQSDDFGNIVYNLIDIGIMSKQTEDSKEHFNDIIDFKTFFESQTCFKIDKETIKRVKDA
jgi:uncharacterized repeat protein (TIGR04138 family)